MKLLPGDHWSEAEELARKAEARLHSVSMHLSCIEGIRNLTDFADFAETVLDVLVLESMHDVRRLYDWYAEDFRALRRELRTADPTAVRRQAFRLALEHVHGRGAGEELTDREVDELIEISEHARRRRGRARPRVAVRGSRPTRVAAVA